MWLTQPHQPTSLYFMRECDDWPQAENPDGAPRSYAAVIDGRRSGAAAAHLASQQLQEMLSSGEAALNPQP